MKNKIVNTVKLVYPDYINPEIHLPPPKKNMKGADLQCLCLLLYNFFVIPEIRRPDFEHETS